jgi:hypothetical protein
MCPGTELNRYGHCCPQDFKSCVSTNSTTGAFILKIILQRTVTPLRVTPISIGACLPIPSRFLSGGVYTNLMKLEKKSRLFSGTLSGRPGSNRPPRPWQGRALPNELLPLILRTHKKSLLYRSKIIPDIKITKGRQK